MIIGLALPAYRRLPRRGLAKMDALVADAAGRGAEIVCFREAYIPGLRGQDHQPYRFEPADEERARREKASATTLVSPDGELFASLPYGEEGVLVADLDLDRATGLLAKRYAPERY